MSLLVCMNCNQDITCLVFSDISLSPVILKCSQIKDQRLIFAGCITCEPYCSNQATPEFIYMSQLYSPCRTRSCNEVASFFPLIIGLGRQYDQSSDQ